MGGGSLTLSYLYTTKLLEKASKAQVYVDVVTVRNKKLLTDDFLLQCLIASVSFVQLLQLQSRFGTDERFRMDARFLESDSEEEGKAAHTACLLVPLEPFNSLSCFTGILCRASLSGRGAAPLCDVSREGFCHEIDACDISNERFSTVQDRKPFSSFKIKELTCSR